MLTAHEFMTSEPLPLHRVQEAVFEFCRSKPDLVLFGAQAVNAHLPRARARMSGDVDVLAPDPGQTAADLAAWLTSRFASAMRVRELRAGVAYRVYQRRGADGKPRHLVDVRRLEPTVASAKKRGLRVVTLTTLFAMKLAALARRGETAKGATDLADLRRLLAAHPALRRGDGIEEAIARVCGADADLARGAWQSLRTASAAEGDDEEDWGAVAKKNAPRRKGHALRRRYGEPAGGPIRVAAVIAPRASWGHNRGLRHAVVLGETHALCGRNVEDWQGDVRTRGGVAFSEAHIGCRVCIRCAGCRSRPERRAP